MPAAFVGRAEELRVLAGLCARAGEARRPAVALVLGQPGQGKSRLLDEVCAAIGSLHPIRIRGYEPEAGIPLAAVRELLSVLAADPAGALVERLLFGPTTASIQTLQLFEAAFRAVRGIGRVVVAADDLHWADPTSLALLHYLVRAAEATSCPLVLMAAARPTVATARFGGSLGEVIGEPPRYLQIDLGPLDRDAGTRLARALAPRLDDAAAVRVWEQAGGSPYWISSLAVEAAGEPSDARLRLDILSADATAVVAVLVVAARPVDRGSLIDIVGRPLERVERAVDELARAGLATDDGEIVALPHDLIRRRVERALPPERMDRAHRRLAAWLERTATDDGQLLEAISHGLRAGLRMGGAALRLAGSPRRRLLGAPGRDLLRSVAAADPGAPETPALERVVARWTAELGEHEQALAAWTAILRRAATPAAASEAALAAAECAVHLGRAAEAERFLDQAARSGLADDATAVEIDARMAAVLLWLRRSVDDGLEAALRAVANARRLVDRTPGGAAALPPPQRQALLRALLAGAEAAILADRPADVLRLTDELAAVAAEEDVQLRIRALAEGSLALRWSGRNADAEARLRSAWAEVRADALPQATGEVGALLARVLYSRGLLTEAEEVLDECRRLGQRLAEYCPSRAFSPIVAPLLDASRGDWHRATEALAAAAPAEENPHYRTHIRLERALLFARLDPRRSTEEVRADVRLALADVAGSGCRRCDCEVRLRSAEALARIGDADGARTLLDAAPATWDNGNRMLAWWAAQAHAAVLAAAGAGEDAAQAWADVVREAEGFGLVVEALWARLDHGTVLAPLDRAEAAEVFRTAGRAAEAMGARTEFQVADQALRALGVRTWRRSAGTGPAELTAREREIAERIAAGASNAEIAAAMFLSRKTVERHVSNVLAKSGLRNRAELAAAWTAAGRT